MSHPPGMQAELYLVSLDRTYPGFSDFCGEGALLQDASGLYTVVRLSDGETVIEDTSRQYLYWSDDLSYWIDGYEDGVGNIWYCQCETAYGAEPVRVEGVTGGGGLHTDAFFVDHPDGTIDMLAPDGRLVRHFEAKFSQTEFVNYLDLNGWAVDPQEEGVIACGVSGEAFPFAYPVTPIWAADGEYRFLRWDTAGWKILIDETGAEMRPRFPLYRRNRSTFPARPFSK